MKIGFIGAGRMGFTLGKHLTEQKEHEVVGFYSKTLASAKEAAKFTDTKYYEDLEKLVFDADALFLTVPDGQIAEMAKMLDPMMLSTNDKILCHTSGALSSQVFSGMHNQIFGYSIHPIYAVNSKLTSYEGFRDCFITLEGRPEYLPMWEKLFVSLGHKVKIIAASDKVKYHSSAVFASNLVVGLYQAACELLMECGFEHEEAECALSTLFLNNAKNIVTYGTKDALTGPVQRCDIETVQKHLMVLEGDKLTSYQAISKILAELAKSKALEQNQRGNTGEEEIRKAYEKLKKML